MSSATKAPVLALNAAERAALLRDPEALAKRAESVLSSLVAKLHKVEAERAAEKIDSERQCHQLERSQVTLREEHERATAQYEKMAADRRSIVEARDASAAEAARMADELREARAEAARLRDAEREASEERQRLLQLGERKRAQLESTEQELAAAHAALADSKRAAADAERKATNDGGRRSPLARHFVRVAAGDPDVVGDRPPQGRGEGTDQDDVRL